MRGSTPPWRSRADRPELMWGGSLPATRRPGHSARSVWPRSTAWRRSCSVWARSSPVSVPAPRPCAGRNGHHCCGGCSLPGLGPRDSGATPTLLASMSPLCRAPRALPAAARPCAPTLRLLPRCPDVSPSQGFGEGGFPAGTPSANHPSSSPVFRPRCTPSWAKDSPGYSPMLLCGFSRFGGALAIVPFAVCESPSACAPTFRSGWHCCVPERAVHFRQARVWSGSCAHARGAYRSVMFLSVVPDCARGDLLGDRPTPIFLSCASRAGVYLRRVGLSDCHQRSEFTGQKLDHRYRSAELVLAWARLHPVSAHWGHPPSCRGGRLSTNVASTSPLKDVLDGSAGVIRAYGMATCSRARPVGRSGRFARMRLAFSRTTLPGTAGPGVSRCVARLHSLAL